MKISFLVHSLIYSSFLFFGCSILSPYPKYIPRKQNVEIKLNSSSIGFSDKVQVYAINEIKEDNTPIVICIHGLGGCSENFRYFFDFAGLNNISVLAFDLRGFGHWSGVKGDIENISVYLNDIMDIIILIKKKYPQRKIVLMGDSLGASIISWYQAKFKYFPENSVDGIIIFSLVTKTAKKVSFKNIINITIGFLFYPKKTIDFSSGPETSNYSSELNKKMLSNQLYTGKVTFRTLYQAKKTIDRTGEMITQISIPILVFQGGKDIYLDLKELKDIVDKSPNIKYIHFEDCEHNMLNEFCGNKIFPIIKNWLMEINYLQHRS